MKPRIRISGSCGGGMVQLGHDAAEVSIGAVPSTPRLSSYDVTILGYSDFEKERPKRVSFDQQCVEALEEGRIICFLHHDEKTLEIIYNKIVSDRVKALSTAHELMPGFHWLAMAKNQSTEIRRVSPPIVHGKVGQPEFSNYLRHWGVSHNFFVGSFDQKVYWAELKLRDPEKYGSGNAYRCPMAGMMGRPSQCWPLIVGAAGVFPTHS
jgi:hypothetical protein